MVYLYSFRLNRSSHFVYYISLEFSLKLRYLGGKNKTKHSRECELKHRLSDERINCITISPNKVKKGPIFTKQVATLEP